MKCYPGGYSDYESQKAASAKAAPAQSAANAPRRKPLDIRVRVKPLAEAKKKEFSCNPFAGL